MPRIWQDDAYIIPKASRAHPNIIPNHFETAFLQAYKLYGPCSLYGNLSRSRDGSPSARAQRRSSPSVKYGRGYEMWGLHACSASEVVLQLGVAALLPRRLA